MWLWRTEVHSGYQKQWGVIVSSLIECRKTEILATWLQGQEQPYGWAYWDLNTVWNLISTALGTKKSHCLLSGRNLLFSDTQPFCQLSDILLPQFLYGLTLPTTYFLLYESNPQAFADSMFLPFWWYASPTPPCPLSPVPTVNRQTLSKISDCVFWLAWLFSNHLIPYNLISHLPA